MLNKKGWFVRQVNKAREDIDTWPEWMLEATRVTGGELYNSDNSNKTKAMTNTQIHRKEKIA